MTNSLRAAIDNALTTVIRAEHEGLGTARHDRRDELGRLRTDLLAMRARVEADRTIESEALRELIRWVASWAPEDDIALLGALGQVARQAGQPSKNT